MSTIKVHVELQFDDDTLGDAPYQDVIPAAVQKISELAHGSRHLGGMAVEMHVDDRAVECAVIHASNPSSPSFGIDYIPRYGADCDSFDDRDCECTYDQENDEREPMACNSSKCPKGTLWLTMCGSQNYGKKRTVIHLKTAGDSNVPPMPEMPES
jgi:hypothetical protein